MLLGREAILGAQDLKTEEIQVPEWGGTVRIQGLTGAGRDAFEESRLVRAGKKRETSLRNFRASLCVRCIVDETGQRLFQDRDADLLGAKSGAALDRVYEVAARLSGITDEDAEELEKNFESDQSDGSGSI